jgi:hypothetical protein
VAKVVNSIDELIKVLKKDVFEAMDDMKKDYKQDNDNPKYVMMQKIDEKVYSGTNSWYENSFGLRESVEATNAMDIGDVVEVGIYHDLTNDKFQANADEWQYGSHYSKKWGEDIREILPEILNNERQWGIIEGLFSSGASFRDKDRAYVDEALKDLKDGRLKRWLLKKMMAKGYEAV